MNIQEIENAKVSEITRTLMFNTMWSRMPQRSFVSGMWLRVYDKTQLFQNCFYHVLHSDKYPCFRYCFPNIILVSPGERGLLLQGTEEERIQYALDMEEKSRGKSTANWRAVKELELELKTLYGIHFPITKGIIVNYQYSLVEQQQVVGKLNKEFWESFNK
jgi:hypothetical protein